MLPEEMMHIFADKNCRQIGSSVNADVINGKSFGLKSRFARSLPCTELSCKKINDDSVRRHSTDRNYFGAANLRPVAALRMTFNCGQLDIEGSDPT